MAISVYPIDDFRPRRRYLAAVLPMG